MGSDTKLDDPIKKVKKKLKRICCCGCGWFSLGILLLIVGIVLLVFFAKDIGGATEWRQNVGYTGIAFVVLGFIVTAIGVGIGVVLFILYRRQERAGRGVHTFKPPTFAYGQAPYPQQKPWPPPQGGVDNPAMPTAPPAGESSVHTMNEGDIKLEITEHQKY